MNDRSIIDLFVARDEQAIRETKEKYGRYCVYIAKCILDDEGEAEECENDVYFALWNSIPPNDPQDLRAYIGAVCRKTALKKLKAQSTQKRGGGKNDAVFEELYEVLSGDEDFTDTLALKDLLGRFLRAQKTETAVIFLQRYWYMRSISEIAEDLKKNENTVKTILVRTREKLRAYLRKEGYLL